MAAATTWPCSAERCPEQLPAPCMVMARYSSEALSGTSLPSGGRQDRVVLADAQRAKTGLPDPAVEGVELGRPEPGDLYVAQPRHDVG